ncbi:MAG TPA: hypothetical protein VFI10_03840 [Gaiellaceae bacterium]|jgi:hypothetical protein|nr:hypothetical protein [Gaiellaceae bacterium]
MDQVIQVGGALLVLAAFILAQARRISPQARTYLLLNVGGASVLAVEAYLDAQWGFLLLEGVWAIVAAWGLSRSLMPARANESSAGI